MEDDVMKELDLVVLTEDLSKHGLKKGDVGTVVLTHREAGYEIEFATLGGETVAVVTVISPLVMLFSIMLITRPATVGAARVRVPDPVV